MMVDVTNRFRVGTCASWRWFAASPKALGEPVQINRSANPRAVTSFVARYKRQDRQEDAMVMSLGAGGAFLQTPVDGAAVGDELELDWALPGDRVAVRAHGVVVWTRPPSPQSPGGLGVRFIRVIPEFARVTQALKMSS